MVVDALGHVTMGSVSHVEKDKKYLVNDFHRLSRLDITLKYSLNGDSMVHHNLSNLWLLM